MKSLPLILALAAAAVAPLALTGCRQETVEVERSLGFDEWVPVYNRHIAGWLVKKKAETQAELDKVTASLASAADDKKPLLEAQLETSRREMAKLEFRLTLGDFFQFRTPVDVPTDLVWQKGLDEPEIGDPRATKGGVIRRHFENLSFPPTLRPYGPNSNHSFRSELYDNIDLPLVTLHPTTLKVIPGVASEWATSPDKRTIYFRIDPEATYSDGEKVYAKDVLLDIYTRASDNVVNPYTKEFYRENYAQVITYGDDLLSVTLPEAKLYAEVLAGTMSPASPKFYKEYGPDYADRYQWRFPPTTGAYEVREEDMVKGVSITQTRVKGWWAKDRKYYRYRFNPDRMVTTLVREESKAFELFRAGELDTYLLTQPQFWYEKSEMPPVYDGYVERATVFNRYPRIPRGFYMNVTKPPLDDRNVRIGIHHAMNWQKVIEVVFRGDYSRLQAFNQGFGKFSDATIRARPYSVQLARDAFRAAGYTEEGPDGILKKPGGARLSVAVTYPTIPLYERALAILKEDAKACGFDLRLDGLESTVVYRKVMQKQHEMNFSGWNTTPPSPTYFQLLHSAFAFDDKGNPKPDTNNLFVWSRPDTDALSLTVRDALTEEELAEASKKLQHIIHDEAIFLPSFTTEFQRVGSWRWVRWPDSAETRYAPALSYEPHEGYCYWIDEDVRKETQEARRSGKTFPEVNRVVHPPETDQP